MANFENYKSNISIEGSYIDNYGTNVTIYGYNYTIYGNKIYSRRGNNVIIVAGAGSDSVTVAGGTKISINGGADYDYIINYEKSWNEETQSYETVAAEKVTIDGGDGNDLILNGFGYNFLNGWGEYKGGNKASIAGGDGNDSIINHSWNPTISGDEGDDIVLSFNDGNVYLYAPGDGNDSIYGFGNEDTLKISSTAYSTQINGEDFVIKVEEVSIIPRLAVLPFRNSHIKARASLALPHVKFISQNIKKSHDALTSFTLLKKRKRRHPPCPVNDALEYHRKSCNLFRFALYLL